MDKIVVLFGVKPTEAGRARYLKIASILKPLHTGFEGL